MFASSRSLLVGIAARRYVMGIRRRFHLAPRTAASTLVQSYLESIQSLQGHLNVIPPFVGYELWLADDLDLPGPEYLDARPTALLDPTPDANLAACERFRVDPVPFQQA